jgi:hypothetical protein
VVPSRTTSCKASTRLATTGTPSGHGFKGTEAKALQAATAGHHCDVEALDRAKDCFARQAPGKAGDGADAQLLRQRLQVGRVISVADHGQSHRQAFAMQPRHGPEQHIDPFDMRQTAGKTQLPPRPLASQHDRASAMLRHRAQRA